MTGGILIWKPDCHRPLATFFTVFCVPSFMAWDAVGNDMDMDEIGYSNNEFTTSEKNLRMPEECDCPFTFPRQVVKPVYCVI